MIRFGNICDQDPAKGLVRVKFQDDGITSFWLPIIVQGALENKYFHPFATNELVACVMDERLENGVVLGAIYSSAAQPDGGSADVVRVKFKDGNSIQYDTAAGELLAEIGDSKVTVTTSAATIENGDTSLELSPAGHDIKKGGESLYAILNDLMTALLSHTHTSAAPGSPTTPPVPPVDLIAIQTRIPQLLKP